MDQGDYLKELASSLLKYRRERFLCDFVIIASNEREIFAHSAIVATASNKLKAAFDQQKFAKRVVYFRLTIPECEVTAVEAVIHFIYTGTLPQITMLQPEHVTAALLAGQKLGLDVSKLALLLSAFVTMSEPSGFEFPPFVLTDEDMYLEIIERDQQPVLAPAIEIIKLTSKQQINSRSQAESNLPSVQDHSYNYPSESGDAALIAEIASSNQDEALYNNGVKNEVYDINRTSTNDFITDPDNALEQNLVSNDKHEDHSSRLDDCSSVVNGEYDISSLHQQNDLLYNIVSRDLPRSVSAIIDSSAHSASINSAYNTISVNTEDISLLSNLLSGGPYVGADNSVSVKVEADPQRVAMMVGMDTEIGMVENISADASSFLEDAGVVMGEEGGEGLEGEAGEEEVTHLKPAHRFVGAIGMGGFKRRGSRPIGSRGGGLVGARQRVILICDQCGKSFQRAKEYTEHKRSHTGERPFSCDLCGKSFSRRRTMTEHRRLHTGDRRYACELCDKRFPTSGELVKHRRFHTGERPYQCNICGKTFSRCGENADHRRMHAGELTCRLCNKDFTRLHNMKEHMNSAHGGEKKFTCRDCGKSFAYSSGLRYHRRLHTDVRPFACQLCGKDFARAGELGRHERSAHKAQIVEIEVYS